MPRKGAIAYGTGAQKSFNAFLLFLKSFSHLIEASVCLFSIVLSFRGELEVPVVVFVVDVG